MGQNRNQHSTDSPADGLNRREYVTIAGALGASTLAGRVGATDDSRDGAESITGSSEAAAGIEQSNQDPMTLQVGMPATVQNLDPNISTAASAFHALVNVHERLFWPDAGVEITPLLAKELRTEDETTWVVPLEEGVQWQPPVDREFVADDVKYTIERLSDPDEYGTTRPQYVESIDEVTVEDDYTVTLHMERPAVAQKALLASYGSEMVPREAVEEFGGNLKQHPVGTGPYMFGEWVQGDHITIEKFDDYWDDEHAANFDRIVFNVVPKDKVRLTGLQTGNLEVIGGLPLNELDPIRDDENTDLLSVQSPAFDYFGVNCGREPFDDVRVRQAMAYAVDRTACNQAGVYGTGIPTQNPYPEDSQWHADVNPYSMSAQPDTARQLLDEAGVSTPITVDLLVDNKFYRHYTEASVIQANLNQVGFDVEVRRLDRGTMLNEEHKSNFDIYVNDWLGFVDPAIGLTPMFHSDGGFNWINYSNEEVDELFDQAAVELDQEKRADFYRQAQEILVDEAPYVWLYHHNVYEADRNYISGYSPHPLQNNTMNFNTTHDETAEGS